jgi:hypothetical protein
MEKVRDLQPLPNQTAGSPCGAGSRCGWRPPCSGLGTRSLKADQEGWVAQARGTVADATPGWTARLAALSPVAETEVAGFLAVYRPAGMGGHTLAPSVRRNLEEDGDLRPYELELPAHEVRVLHRPRHHEGSLVRRG